MFRIRAGAKETKVAGKLGEVWKLHITEPPVDGRANEALTRYLSKLCSLANLNVRVVKGFTSTLKLVEFDGISTEGFIRVILEAHGTRTYSGSSPTPER